ncbi:hypothetical protein H072_1178 [Dactylellina haptotyla CBS 200.50]|uniref:Nucleoside phosphorylase domain-containing protein n=1 Tax=Dactylellina haptotyla (strain CBS 200.50) TaxID=1284197 RepID=S8APP0_DACHA|nr:hypothetical protein H072_1178 [Dactylellina haptotyla CBS 200.50]
MTVDSEGIKTYWVGWICSLPEEMKAARALLDEVHQDQAKRPGCSNSFIIGSIGNHNVAITCLPKHTFHDDIIEATVECMTSAFPSVYCILLVGVGSGIPSKVRLGDVVIGSPTFDHQAAIQWELRNTKEGNSFHHIRSPADPSHRLLAALSKFEALRALNGSKIPSYIERMAARYPDLEARYSKSDGLVDILFRSTCAHIDDTAAVVEARRNGYEEEACNLCDKTKAIERKPMETEIHYGTIAYGNQEIKDGTLRDQLKRELGDDIGILCLDWGNTPNLKVPHLVFRGICDYADSHNSQEWRKYAAAVAAACAKEYLSIAMPARISDTHYL